jgi:hypothetical protein
MLKKTIKFVDYDGEECTEDYYFNLTRAEAVEWFHSEKGGLENYLKKISSEKDNKRLIELFKDIILKTYGVKSTDGKRFIKSPELALEFSQTEAYVELFTELASSAEAAEAFVKGVAPKVPNKETK